MIKRILLSFLQLFFVLSMVYSQGPKFSRIRISDDVNISEIGSLGIPVDNMDYRPGAYFVGEYSEDELLKLDQAGIAYEVLIDDMAYYYVARNQNADKSLIEAEMRDYDPTKEYQTPENFHLGSMGGYHTNSEAMEDLDQMVNLYPDLISVRQPLSSDLTTHEDRSVYWVRISNNPQQEQDKPKVLYTALTHAREPASLQQMLFQMWYLLENYGTDPEVTYLVDNLEMYFIPVVNPDGYIYNQTTNPNGGGMHRKNMRINSSGNYGVDLNRNYGFQWGYDDSGSSPSSSSNTYRGPSPFSEPETQMIKEFAETYDFKLALNHHTYSDLLIYPWGYENLLTPDADIFSEAAKILTRENQFTYGTVYETLNYLANGGSDDWFYGEQQTKDKVYSFTPEAGSPTDGFWPQMNRIEDICEGNLYMNLTLAHLALPYAEIAASGNESIENTFDYDFQITSYGIDTAATYTVSVNPISPLITAVGPPVTFENMSTLETGQGSIMIELNPSTPEGLVFDFEVVLDNGSYTWRDTIERAVGWPNYLFYDEFEDDSNWISNSWGLESANVYSAPFSMADSPGANYPDNYNAELTLKDTIDLSGYSKAFVSFYARWNTENNYDFAQFRVSEDFGETWVPLAGSYTQTGSSNQDQGKPLYQGTQQEWVHEQISLDAYIGKQIMLNFRMKSDNSVNNEGFFFDDFGISALTAFEPVQPVITGQAEVKLPVDESFEMQSEMLTVEDDYFSYPQGFTINLHEGENYSIQDNTIVPESGFLGDLKVNVSVNNGILESDVYEFTVNYYDPLSTSDINSYVPHIFYNQNLKQLTIEPGNKFPVGHYLLILYDIFGREILRREVELDNSFVNIPADLKPGVYLFDLTGEEVISGKIPVFGSH